MVPKHLPILFQNVTSPLTHISPYTLKRTTIRPVCARGRSLFLGPRDAKCSREGSNRGEPSAGKGGRGAGAKGEREVVLGGQRKRESERETRGRGDWSATGVTSTAPDRPEGQPARPASFSRAASSRSSRGGGRKGFPVQEAAQAAAASSLTLLSPAPPIPHCPRRRVPTPLAADHPHSVRQHALPGSTPAPPSRPSRDP